MTIHGASVKKGTKVTVDGIPVVADEEGDCFICGVVFVAPAHPSGPVDIVVTNPNGDTDRLVGAITYAPTSTFDMNGIWDAYLMPNWNGHFTITLENDAVVSVTCATTVNLVTSTPAPIVSGEFSLAAAGGTITGRAASSDHIVGNSSIPQCGASAWLAFKR
jgi:hypothetical protein